ncbi:helix-turn-helix domain-containing protein [Candidatus Mycolicibacterium alkanivorans]|uniref:helix-turn-helix domain-containing protein n=1 Tax=Candidatus Mycolicibacterium alkanivorans TaxID=2954114 RepID=UPI0027E176F8|nr:helix-turn-helix domain-containing protein [Candidatus Mycolicibacterium alkanivorans]
MRRYEAKAEELGVGLRTLRRWVNDFRQSGEAGLVESAPSGSPTGRVDDQWVETAVEVMVARPSECSGDGRFGQVPQGFHVHHDRSNLGDQQIIRYVLALLAVDIRDEEERLRHDPVHRGIEVSEEQSR